MNHHTRPNSVALGIVAAILLITAWTALTVAYAVRKAVVRRRAKRAWLRGRDRNGDAS